MRHAIVDNLNNDLGDIAEVPTEACAAPASGAP